MSLLAIDNEIATVEGGVEATGNNLFPVFLKLENFQTTGSFKVRGAYYKMWWEGEMLGLKN